MMWCGLYMTVNANVRRVRPSTPARLCIWNWQRSLLHYVYRTHLAKYSEVDGETHENVTNLFKNHYFLPDFVEENIKIYWLLSHFHCGPCLASVISSELDPPSQSIDRSMEIEIHFRSIAAFSPPFRVLEEALNLLDFQRMLILAF